MANQESPAQGHIIEVHRIRSLIVDEHQKDFDDLYGYSDVEGLQELFHAHSHEGVVVPQSVFMLGDEDTGDGEMEIGTIYAYFELEQLYELKLKPEAEVLQRIVGDLPTQHSWTIFS